MPRPLTERMVSAVSGVSRLSTVNGPSGDARAAAIASRELKAKRSETSDGGGSTHAAVRARSNAPAIRPSGADGSLGAAEGRHDVAAEPRPKVHSVYGALDLGTNNCRLLIAKPSQRGFLVIDAFSRIIRLGEGVLNSGQLSLLLRAKFLIDAKGLNKVQGRPFLVSEIEEAIDKILG